MGNKESLLYKWIKFGEVSVCEGNYGIAVGNKETGYSTFASKTKLNIHKSGKVTYEDESGYMGCYEDRKTASDTVRAVDKALSNGKAAPVTISITDGGGNFKAFSQSDPKTGGVLLVYSEESPGDLVHEEAHYLLGHHTEGGMGKTGRSGILEEKEAVKAEIRLLKLRGQYNRYTQRDIIQHLSTYFKDKDLWKRIKKAEAFVKEAEKLG